MVQLLYYIPNKSKSISSTRVELGEPVDILRKNILAEGAPLPGLGRDQLTLWKVNIDLNKVSFDSLNGIQLENALGVEKMEPWKQVSTYWPESDPPLVEHLNVIVEFPATMPSSNSDSSLHLDIKWARREHTTRIIYQLLNKERLVLVRGTPGSGKTTLLKLLRNFILQEEGGAKVHVISNWFNVDLTPENQYRRRLTSRVPGLFGQSHEIVSKTFILFDNGQDTYWDEQLWEHFFKDHQQRASGYRIILFSSYGSPTKRPVKYAHGVPPLVPPRARISLQRQNHSTIREPIGLLLTREEFDDVVEHADEVILDRHLRDFIFESTDGHVGAVVGLLEVLSCQFATKQRNRIPLTMDDFKAMDKANLWHELGTRSAFGRGLPERKELAEVPVADVFETLLIYGFVLSGDVTAEVLDTCYRSGWIQADVDHVVDDSGDYDEDEIEPVRYTFPSSLHRSYVSWRLMPIKGKIPYETVLQLAIAVIKQFDPSQLSDPLRQVGGLSTDCPIEPQYQKEFSRALFDVVGPAYMSPECGTERGSRKGRIDFFIRSKKWGIELLRDGSNLQEHSSRFGEEGAYGMWIPTKIMLDYLILDFRSSRPQVAHPQIPKLYHVVFEDDYTSFTILDNNLRTVGWFARI